MIETLKKKQKKAAGTLELPGEPYVVLQVLKKGQKPFTTITYQEIGKSCGRKSCRVCSGNQPLHGPYWRQLIWDTSGKKMRIKQLGKTLPSDVEAVFAIQQLSYDPAFRLRVSYTEELARRVDQLSAQFSEEQEISAELRKRNESLRKQVVQLREKLKEAEDVLKIGGYSRDNHRNPGDVHASRVYKRLAMKYHPDHGHKAPNLTEIMADINELYDLVRKSSRDLKAK